jgi:predicted transcriptional regulator of viral defense system
MSSMNTVQFFNQYPVFTHEEFVQYLESHGTTNSNTQREILANHLNKQNIIRIRRGLFATIPMSVANHAEGFHVDPYLLASRISTDSILAYHTAFDFHGISYSTPHQFTVLSQKDIRSFSFQQAKYIGLPHPQILIKKNKIDFEVMTAERQGLMIKVTSIERSLVDMLHRPLYAYGWEELWRSAYFISILNLDKIIEYANLLDNATTFAKLGFFLQEFKKQFSVDETSLMQLETKKPVGVHYLAQNKRNAGKLVKRWNLIVPDRIIQKAWEEPNNDLI